jgi:hypothetical protein
VWLVTADGRTVKNRPGLLTNVLVAILESTYGNDVGATAEQRVEVKLNVTQVKQRTVWSDFDEEIDFISVILNSLTRGRHKLRNTHGI